MPPQIHPGSSDARNTFEDLSGIDLAAFSNPYDALIEACHDDPKQIQSRYSMHRIARNAKQKANLLGTDFKGLNLDAILQRLEDPSIEPDFVDPRHSLVFWARPPPHIKTVVSQIQQRLKKLAPNLWLMPIPNLHMTTLEVTHSVTESEVFALIAQLQPLIPLMTDYPFTHRTRLAKPLLSYDSTAIALSFLPAAGEGLSHPVCQDPQPATIPNTDPSTYPASPDSPLSTYDRTITDDAYTYHHLRRSLYTLASSAGIAIESRYVVPSAHITIGRFLSQEDHDTPEKMERWIEEIEGVNRWLEVEFWPRGDGEQAESINEGGEWIVGEGKGLDLRKGKLWYGGGETVMLGKGF